MVVLDPCGYCNKAVAKNHRALQCDNCNFWFHIKCNNISPAKYSIYLDEENNETWVCNECLYLLLPIGLLEDKPFYVNGNGIQTELNLENIDCSLKPKEKNLIKQITNLIIENTDPDNCSNFCEYYDPKKFIKKNSNLNKTFPYYTLILPHYNFTLMNLTFSFKPLNILLISLQSLSQKFKKTLNQLKISTFPTTNTYSHQLSQQKEVH